MIAENGGQCPPYERLENGGQCPPYERLAIPACRQAGQSVIRYIGNISKSLDKTVPRRGGFIPPVSIAAQSVVLFYFAS